MAEEGGDSFDLESWFQEINLKPDTIDKLKKEDLSTRKDLARLSPTDIANLKLTIGQTNALKDGVGKLKSSEAGGFDTQSRSIIARPCSSSKSARPAVEVADESFSQTDAGQLDAPYTVNRLLQDQPAAHYIGNRFSTYWAGSDISELDQNVPNTDNKPNEHFETLLRRLNISQSYPSKISLQQVMAITNKMREGAKLRVSDIALVLLRNLIMLGWDYRDNLQQENLVKNPDECNSNLSSIDDIFDAPLIDNMIHPQDIFLISFLCCDRRLKQALVHKLVLCSLSVPLIYPILPGSELEYSLWPLKSAVIEWKTKENREMSGCLATTPMHVISCCRYGDIQNFSKSKFLNEIIRNSAHPTFYHRDCPGSMSKRSISEGTIESSWVMPANNTKEELLQNVTMIMNLRGSGQRYYPQVRFMAQTSSLLIIILNVETLGEAGFVNTAKRLAQKGKILLLLNKQGDLHEVYHKNTVRTFCTAIGELKTNVEVRSLFASGSYKNATAIRKDLAVLFQTFLTRNTMITPERLADFCKRKEYEIHIDENTDECSTGKSLAKKVIVKEPNTDWTRVKDEQLPLQKYWVEWSKHQKSAKRAKGCGHNLTAFEAATSHQHKMLDIRNDQLQLCLDMKPMISSFIDGLVHCYNPGEQSETMSFYLQWLKIALDDNSRAVLPGILADYQNKWKKYREAKVSKDICSEDLLCEVRQAEDKHLNATFGLEHLFREVGQLYEVIVGLKATLGSDIQTKIKLLPDIVAQLLLSGQAFELMDGDASNIPQTWIEAIFKSLVKLAGEKNVFIIGVLGIQSSGKSTLLNAMFGLQLSVSAGRCTRGVYMQMVKVDKGKTTLPFDYVLVIDSEGLRAPEKGNHSVGRDNEIATFVIGLSDITVMNIKGENYVEMNDILQVSVLAFLRMKRVSFYKHSHHRCLFIHQNVSAINAEGALRHSCQKLQEHLDNMTVDAAKHEKELDIECFNQIIDFDCYTHVHYFPDLWNGNPPNAHVNIGYNENVRKVTNQILFDLSRKQKSYLSMADVFQRINDLWRAILQDDFVFSFRNCLEIKAFHHIEKKEKSTDWENEDNVNNWVASKARPNIGSRETEDCATESKKYLVYELNELISGRIRTQINEMKAMCSTGLYCDILYKWESTKIEQLEKASQQLLSQTTLILTQLQNDRKLEILNAVASTKHQHEIMKKAQELASQMRGSIGHDDAFLKVKFEEMWQPWQRELETNLTEPMGYLQDVEKVIHRVISEMFPAHLQFIKQNQELHPFNSTTNLIEKLETSLNRDEIDYQSTSQAAEDVPEKAAELIESVFIEAENMLKEVETERFQDGHMRQILNIIFEKTRNSDLVSTEVITFPHNFEIKLAYHIASYALPIFRNMQHKNQQSFQSEIESYKTKIWAIFKNTIQDKENEVIAAETFCETVGEKIKCVVSQVVEEKVLDIAVTRFVTKQGLIMAVLRHMADQVFFDLYDKYLTSPIDLVKQWLVGYLEKDLFSYRDISSELSSMTSNQISRLVESVKESFQTSIYQAKEDSTDVDMNNWAKLFSLHAQSYIIMPSTALTMVTQTKVTDYEHFRNCVLNQFEVLENSMQRELCIESTFSASKYNDLSQRVLDRLWGCIEICPFCKEPCKHSDPKHKEHNVRHMCLQHIPQGLRGVRWHKSNDLVCGTCNYLIQIKASFRCSSEKCITHELCRDHSSDEVTWHEYTAYEKHVPGWDIGPSDAAETSKYWIWVFCKFNKSLATLHSVKEANIPEYWSKISKEEAVASLDQIYGPSTNLYITCH